MLVFVQLHRLSISKLMNAHVLYQHLPEISIGLSFVLCLSDDLQSGELWFMKCINVNLILLFILFQPSELN